MKIQLLSLFFIMFIVNACNQTADKPVNQIKIAMNNDSVKVEKTEEEWKKVLTPEQYKVLRQKGTEAPYTGKFNIHNEKGVYVCAACGNELFSSDMKFESTCGWPSFDKEIAGGKIKTQTDTSYGMKRTEILCGRCGSHLGHLFDDGPTETGMRYCVNSVSLDFLDSSKVSLK